MPDQPEDRHPSGAEVPSMLDLVRQSPRLLFPPGGRELYRQIALLARLEPDEEVLVAGCGNGVTLEYFVREHGVQGSGAEHDPAMVEAAQERARTLGLAESLQFQQAAMDRLPYRDHIFDVTVGELALTTHADPKDAVRELVRVTRPGGVVILVQLVWKAPVDEARREVLSRHLGVRPLMLVEWKRLLREAGVSNLHTEDWSDAETAFRSQGVKPFPDFSELFSLPEKIGILRRAWLRWGWRGLWTALVREWEVHRLLTRERILGLDLLKGTRVVEEGVAEVADASREDVGGGEEASKEEEPSTGREVSAGEETEGLPLFSSTDQNP